MKQERGNQGRQPKKRFVSRRDFLKGGSLAAAGAMLLGTEGVLTGCSDDQSRGPGAGATSDSDNIEIFETDVLVIGTGVGGSLAALQAYSDDANVLVVDKGPFRASGVTGMNWDAGCFIFEDPIPNDVTVSPWNESGRTWCDQLTNQKVAAAVEDFVGQSADAWNMPLIFARLGTPSFVRNEDGTAFNAFPPGSGMRSANGIFARNNLDYMDALDISVVDNTMITDFFMSDDICVGAMGIHVPTGTYRVFRSKATVLATGGSTQMYGWLRTGAVSINSPDNTGDTITAAMRHGCSVINPEFLSYDLISFVPESLGAGFGAGMGADSTNQGLVCDKDGDYFLASPTGDGYVPITRIAIDKIREGKGGEHGGVFLNMADPEAEHLSHPTYRRNIELWKTEFGIDVEEPGYLVEVGPEAFESQGQITVDETAMTEIPGLFNVRGTGLTLIDLNAQPVASYAAHQAALYAKDQEVEKIDWSGVEDEIARLEEIHSKEGTIRPMELRHKIQNAVYDALSLGADADGLNAAIAEIDRIKSEDMPNMGIVNKTKCFNLEWKQAIENHNLLYQAEAMLRASLNREESRGFFYRVDFPDQDDANWLVDTYARLVDDEVQIETEPVVTI